MLGVWLWLYIHIIIVFITVMIFFLLFFPASRTPPIQSSNMNYVYDLDKKYLNLIFLRGADRMLMIHSLLCNGCFAPLFLDNFRILRKKCHDDSNFILGEVALRQASPTSPSWSSSRGTYSAFSSLPLP